VWSPSRKNVLVIFGAGASYDFARNSVGIPITKDLFTQHNNFYSQALNGRYGRRAQAIIDEIIEKFQSDAATFSLEDTLSAYQRRSQTSIRSKQALLGFRFFLCDLIQLYQHNARSSSPFSNNYVRMLRKLQSWQEESSLPINLVTFNYDTLLDTACETIFQVDFENSPQSYATLNSYIDNEDVKLFKPHGSVNWVRNVDRYGDEDLISEVSSAEINLSRYALDFKDKESDSVQLPALSIPFKDEKEFEWPDTHKGAFLDSLEGVEKVFLIGWKAAEPHFTKLIKDRINRDAKWIIVGRSAASSNLVLENLARLEISNTFRYDRGFSNFVDSAEFKQELVALLDGRTSTF
jgi:hypothetical protein